MEKVLEYIKKNSMVKPGQVIGVGVSGGIDSMVLLHFLNEHKHELDIEVVAVHVNHGIREESDDDALFVLHKCKEWGVRVYKFSIDAPKIAKDKKMSIETAAREGRYGVFDALIKKDIVDKIALAHHQSDQAETILMHIFRGSGLAGARGMEPVRGNFIRPLLQVSKEEIEKYATEHNVDYVDDATNADTSYSRNFVRNVVMKNVLQKWPNAVEAINNFAKAVCEDDDYIMSHVDFNSLIVDDHSVQMPCSYFNSCSAIYSRIVFKVMSLIGVTKDIERKHIEMIKDLAFSENGKKIRLPFDVVVSKEYDFLTFVNNHVEKPKLGFGLQLGEFDATGFGKVCIKRVNASAISNDGQALFFDWRKVPKDAVWRLREDGDVFEKFGGGTKKLKSFLIDKKIPVRVRDFIPVLASGNEVYVIAGVEVSNKVRVEDVATCCKLTVEKK